jgi:hypothetical protein
MSELQFRTDSNIPADGALLDCFDLFRQRARSITARLKMEGISTFGELVRARRKLERILDSANLALVSDFLSKYGYPIPSASEA